MEGTLSEQLEAYAAAGREIFPAYSEAVDRLAERIHENGGGENAPRPGEGTVEQDMDSHKKYLVETLKVTLRG